MLIELERFRHMYFFSLAIWFSLLSSATILAGRVSFQLQFHVSRAHHQLICVRVLWFGFLWSLCEVLLSLDLDYRFGIWSSRQQRDKRAYLETEHAHELLVTSKRSILLNSRKIEWTRIQCARHFWAEYFSRSVSFNCYVNWIKGISFEI